MTEYSERYDPNDTHWTMLDQETLHFMVVAIDELRSRIQNLDEGTSKNLDELERIIEDAEQPAFNDDHQGFLQEVARRYESIGTPLPRYRKPR